MTLPRTAFYWADYDDKAYAVAIWSTPIAANRLKDGWKKLELRRLAVAPDVPRNSCSRLLAVMQRLVVKKWPDLIQLVSYQDVEAHTGTIYRAAGWHCDLTSRDYKPWGRRQRDHGLQLASIVQTGAPKARWVYDLVKGTK
jgi:hypothetical protein